MCATFAAPDTRLALIGLSEDDLRSILSRCYVCRSAAYHHNDDGGDILGGSPLILRFSRVITSGDEVVCSERQPTEPETIPDQDADAYPSTKKTSDRPSSCPLPGLPEETKNMLTRILDKVDGGGYVVSGGDALASLMKQLSSAITSCNSRISQLSTCTKGVADNAKLAATSRCRACRDELIQLCKQIKLASDQQSEAASTAAGGAHGLLTSRKWQSRLQSTVLTGLRSILERSERFDAWETPDERVAKLRLDRNMWASGVPDFEFYQEGDARATENKRKQRELSRKLQQRRRRRDVG